MIDLEDDVADTLDCCTEFGFVRLQLDYSRSRQTPPLRCFLIFNRTRRSVLGPIRIGSNPYTSAMFFRSRRECRARWCAGGESIALLTVMMISRQASELRSSYTKEYVNQSSFPQWSRYVPSYQRYGQSIVASVRTTFAR